MTDIQLEEIEEIIYRIDFFRRRMNLLYNCEKINSCVISFYSNFVKREEEYCVGDEIDEGLFLDKLRNDLIVFYNAKIDELKKELENIMKKSVNKKKEKI